MRMCRLTRLLWLAGLLAFASATAAELPITDFVKHPELTNPVISPDGKYLAVILDVDTKGGDPDEQLAVLQLPDLKPVSRLAMAPHFVPIDVIWVSDQRLVMALGKKEGSLVKPEKTSTIIAVNYDGSDKQILYSPNDDMRTQTTGTMLGGHNFNLVQMPRGIAGISGMPDKPNGHLFLNLQLFGSNTNYTSWDTVESRVYDVEARSGHATMIGDIDHGRMDFLVHDDVARIAFGKDANNHTVAFASTDGKHWTQMPDSSIGQVFLPLTISRDGKRLYAWSSMDGGPNALVSCNLDGSDRKVLASDPFSSVTGEMWNPETLSPIAAVFDAGGRPRVRYLDDGIYAQVMQALAKGLPDDFVSMAGSSSDGMVLLINVRSDQNPGSYALFNRATMHARPLYQVLPWIKPAQMPHRLSVHFKNRSGTELAGFLTLPLGAPQKLPLVLIPHGGPIGPSDSWFYDPWAALLANRGYATLQINYRGSGGRGANFQDSGYKQFGSGIQDDLIDGVKWAIAHGYVDPNRICVFGGSFGGYSALMQPIVAPKLYKCAIDYAGVYDWRIGMDKSDTRRYAGGRTYFTDAIGSRDDAYAMSPASMMDRFNVPVLIAHGKDDPRVPYENATKLRSALKKADKPYEWLTEPDELHGFYSEQHNEVLFTKIQAFLAQYIGPGAISSSGAH